MQNLNGWRVLVIDNDVINLNLFSFWLETKGAESVIADSAQEGLHLWEEYEVHVVVCDISMPNKDGFWFIEQLRAREAELGKQTPAIALTGVASDAMRQATLAAGFQMCLFKPVELNGLFSALLACLSPSRTPSTLLS